MAIGAAASSYRARSRGVAGGLAHLIYLPEMTTVVRGDDPQAGRHAEIHHLEKRIPVSRPVHIDVCRVGDEQPNRIVSGAVIRQNLMAVLRQGWLHAPGRAQAPLNWRLERVDK